MKVYKTKEFRQSLPFFLIGLLMIVGGGIIVKFFYPSKIAIALGLGSVVAGIILTTITRSIMYYRLYKNKKLKLWGK